LNRIHRLLPTRIEPERIQAALVAARMEEALGSGPNDFM
jgi:NCAIR mutase (PurE)-related protein